ncbi:hypothetical protein Tco_1557006 [Tanacetum coccineum]
MHIEIRHHFIRDSYEKKLIQVIKIHTDHNVADLLTKAFDLKLVGNTARPKVSTSRQKLVLLSQSSSPRCQDTILGGADAQTRFETSSKQSNDPPLSKRLHTWKWGRQYETIRIDGTLYKIFRFGKQKEKRDVFWATTKIKTVNGECQIQALVDKKKVIIIESSIRSDLHLEDADGTDCLPTATIFEELARMGVKTTAWNEFSSIMASAITCLAKNQKFNMSKYIFDAMVGDMSHHKKIYVNPSHIKKIFANMKREGKDFSGRKEQSRRKQKKTNAVPHLSDSTADVLNEESVPTHSNNLLLSGEDRFKLTDLMDMYTKLSERVLDLEHTKTAQAQEITNLKLRDKKLEKKIGLRTHKFKRLYKVGVTRRVEYSDDESLGAQEDTFNQGRSIKDINKDAEVSLVDETQGRSDDAEMFNTDALIGNEVFAKNDMIEKDQDVIPKEVSTGAPSTTPVSPPSTAITTHSTIPKAKGITFRDAGESITRTPTSVSSSSIKDKWKAKMDEPEVPLKKKDQNSLDEEMARNLKAQIQAELIEEERLTRKKEEEANIALIES